ncbi:hypothetical protein A2U01_0052683, partial [Trifolium medium]|nr:hypothetical protein [Trifolium medium]
VVPSPIVVEKSKKKVSEEENEGGVENESEGVVENHEKQGVAENESEIEEVVESQKNGVVENKREKNNAIKQEASSKEGGIKNKVKTQEEVPYPRIPYPRKKKLKTKDHHFKKFMKMLNSLQVNLPLAEALECNTPIFKAEKGHFF